MHVNIILGNILSGLGAICCFISVAQKSKKKLIWWGAINILFSILSNITLLAFAALVTNFFGIVRNILVCKNRLTLRATFLLSVSCFVTGIYMNNLGIVGLLAIVASVSLTIFMFITKNAQQMRYVLLLNCTLWIIHDYCIKSFPSVLMGILFIIWTIIQIVKHRKHFQPTSPSSHV